jgi:proteasome accessory factor B
VLTVSRKIERLVNLTIALLATKRFLTKAEIFRTVEGYEGTPETKERMFERDKDDLRTLGIRIDVGSFDPLFSDESGYRIRSENYQLDLGAITPTELALLSLAAEAWQGAAMEDAAQSAILKLKSIGVAADTLDIPAVPLKISNSSKDLNTITDAIAVSDLLAFDYLSANMDIQQRVLVPFALSNKNGFWYLTGVEQEILEIRTFRLDRIQGAIQQRGNREAFEFPEDFDISSSLNVSSHETAIIDVRKGRGFSLRALATSTKDLGEWDQLVVPIFNLENLASQVLWHGLDAHVQEPAPLKQHMVKQLRALVANHG